MFFLFFLVFFVFPIFSFLLVFSFFHIFLLFFFFLFAVVRADANTGKNRREVPLGTIFFGETLIFGPRWARG